MSRDSEVAAIDVIDQRGEGQQRDYPVYRARTRATLVVNWEGQVLSVDILSTYPGTGKQLLVAGRGIRPAVPMELINMPEVGGCGVVLGIARLRGAEEEPGRNIRRRAPACRAGAPRFSALPAAPAVANSRFDSGVILPGTGKVGVQIIDFD